MSRRVVGGLVGLASVAALAVAFWPAGRPQVSYPFARRAAGAATDPLWRISPEAMDALSRDDAGRLEHAIARLDVAVREAERQAADLASDRIDHLGPEGRERVRQLWWSLFDPLVAIDAIKHRYEGWYGIDYLHHPRLHARAFGLTLAALLAQFDAGQRIVTLVRGNQRVRGLWNERMPAYGVPAGTFLAMQQRLVRARDYQFVPVGVEWYDQWIARHLGKEATGKRIHRLIGSHRAAALRWLGDRQARPLADNTVNLMRDSAFASWFPAQKELATWFGDTRVAPQDRRLIRDAQLAEMKRALRPGDILVERRNWYLSNVGLPGFWPHAALYLGTQEDIRGLFDADESVRARFGVFSEYLARRHPAAWRALGGRDEHGNPRVVLEAISEGVVAASFEHSCGADYVAALRTRLPTLEIAGAVDRALAFFGRPYDFNFDFATDDQVVCSELVMKAFEPQSAEGPGLRVPAISVAGKQVTPPTEIVRAFASAQGRPEQQLDFVYFLDGREATHDAVTADATALAASCVRPKWDIAQP